MAFRSVIFDWRGTLVTTMTPEEWVRQALVQVGMPAASCAGVLGAIDTANGPDDRLDGPGVDSNAQLHRSTFMQVFEDAGLRPDLAAALYDLEGDAANNPFALDVAETFQSLRQADLKLAVVSDIHFDLRPAFEQAGLLQYIDTFTLSFEQGIQKPNAMMFTRTLAALGVEPDECLMVGDRSHPDGPAVEQGITTLLVPPLRDVGERRLHHVQALCGVGRTLG